jgi:AcrR family transcriptional regulator
MNVHSQLPGPAPDPASARREDILSAALDLFVDHGFDGTSVPAVATAAGIAAGTIYRHFDSKETLVNELYRRCKTALMTRLLDRFPFEAAPRAQFHAFWTRLGAFAAAHPRALAFLELNHHAAYLDHHSRALEESSLRPIYDFVETARRSGAIKDVPAEALMALVWGAFVGLLKANHLGHLILTGELVETTEACIWDAIARPPA